MNRHANTQDSGRDGRLTAFQRVRTIIIVKDRGFSGCPRFDTRNVGQRRIG